MNRAGDADGGVARTREDGPGRRDVRRIVSDGLLQRRVAVPRRHVADPVIPGIYHSASIWPSTSTLLRFLPAQYSATIRLLSTN